MVVVVIMITVGSHINTFWSVVTFILSVEEKENDNQSISDEVAHCDMKSLM